MTGAEATFRWLGVGGFEWQTQGYSLLLDPVLTRPSIWQVLTGRLEPRANLLERYIQEVGAIIVSHAHYDHLMDAPYLAIRTGAPIYGSHNTIELSRIHEVPDDQLCMVTQDASFRVGPFQISLLPGEHVPLPGISSGPLADNLRPPLRAQEFRMDRCDSSLVEFNGDRWLVWHSVETENAPQADILVVGPEGSKDFFRKLCSRVRPKLLIPIHWENFFRSVESPLKQLPVRRHFPASLGLGQGERTNWDLGEDLKVPVFTPRILETYALGPFLA
jgi:L-ascorbate metabolism protein UlaG (beta-lactamase superfamily)